MQQNSLEGNGSKCFDRDKWGKSSQSFFKHEHHVFFYSKLRLLLNYYYFYNRIWLTNSLQNNLNILDKKLVGSSRPKPFWLVKKLHFLTHHPTCRICPFCRLYETRFFFFVFLFLTKFRLHSITNFSCSHTASLWNLSLCLALVLLWTCNWVLGYI